jgi:rhamnosyltransferase
MEASIVVLTKNAGQTWERLLQRLFSQKFNGEYEVIVIDSGSSDATVEIARRYPTRLVTIPPEEFHHGRTRNLGAGLARGEILVYITQDALPLRDDWLQKLVDNFADPGVAMVCGRQMPWQHTKPPERFFYLYNFPDLKLRITAHDPDYYHDNLFISDVNSALRKDIWQQFRFSEKVIVAEDKELAARLLAAGWTIIYEPEAAVYHAHELSLKEAFDRYATFGIALAQGSGGLPRSRNWLAHRIGHLIQEMRFILGHYRWWYWLPYSIAYELSKLLGIACGWLVSHLRER